MKLIGENLNIMSKKYGKALKERDAKTLQELAIQEAEAGMDWVDLNIGPAGKTGCGADELAGAGGARSGGSPAGP